MTKTRLLSCCTAFALTFSSLLAWAQPVSLNLKNADIRSVIDMVSGITGKNFIVDPRVKGKVTLVSSTPVEPEEVYDIFLSIMKVHGYVALEEGGIVNILPENEGVRGAPLDSQTANNSQMQVQVVPVNNVKATQLVPALKPLVSKNGHLSAHSSSNTLVISDTSRRLRRLIEIIRRLDVQEDMGLAAVRLQHAAASQVIKTLQPLLSGSGKGKGSVFSEGIAAGDIKLAADDRSNTVLMTGSKQVLKRLRHLVEQMDTPVAHQGETRVVYLKFAKAVDLAEVLRSTLAEKYQGSKSTKNRTATERQVSIQADEDMNALLITAGPDQHTEIQAVIQALDVRRAQVLVESLIVEMSDDKARSLGIQWLAGHEDLVQLSGASTLAATALQQGNLVGLMKAGRGLNIGILARALANDGDANIISTPSLITLDNAEAEINVGREVPFVTGSYTGTGGSSGADNPFTTIQRNDVGLKMKITPQINQGSAIRLDIDQEISNLLPGAAAQFGASDLVTSKRSIKTSVVVEDGNILVLGGLVDDTLRESQVKVPMLGDVPVLGQLFNYREATKEKRNLMIFIRPKILRDAESSRALSEQRYAGIRDQQLERYRAGSDLLSRDEIPLLENRATSRDEPAGAKQKTTLPLSDYTQFETEQIPGRARAEAETLISTTKRSLLLQPVVPESNSPPASMTYQNQTPATSPVRSSNATQQPVVQREVPALPSEANQTPNQSSVPGTSSFVRQDSANASSPATNMLNKSQAKTRAATKRPLLLQSIVSEKVRPKTSIIYQNQISAASFAGSDNVTLQPVVRPDAPASSSEANQIPDNLSVPGTSSFVRQDSSAVVSAQEQVRSRLRTDATSLSASPAPVIYQYQQPMHEQHVVPEVASVRHKIQQVPAPTAKPSSPGKTQKQPTQNARSATRPSLQTTTGISVPDPQQRETGGLINLFNSGK
ncbi:MAG: type II secretion system secretin GspD [Pseudomonadota bacterium]